jgi:hypothetical protein
MSELQQRAKFQRHMDWGHQVVDAENCIWTCTMRLSGGEVAGMPLPDCGPFVFEGPNKKAAERGAAEQAWAHLQGLGLVELCYQQAVQEKTKPVWVWVS